MKKEIKKSENHERIKNKSGANVTIISSLAYLVLGFIMIFMPDTVGNTLSYVLGIVLTVYGLFNIISYFLGKEQNLYMELTVGIIATAFGIFTLFSPGVIAKIIFVIFGIIIIIDSLLDVKHSIQLKALGMKKWWICLLVSVAIIIIGLSTIFFADFFRDFLIFILGIIMIYEGVSGLVMIGLMSHYAKKFGNDKKMINVEAIDKN